MTASSKSKGDSLWHSGGSHETADHQPSNGKGHHKGNHKGDHAWKPQKPSKPPVDDNDDTAGIPPVVTEPGDGAPEGEPPATETPSIHEVIYGTEGADAMYGGEGNDTYYVNHVGDKAYELPGQGNDTVIASVSYSLYGQVVENLILTGDGPLNGTGNTLHNKLTGNSASNILDGGDRNDVLNGKGGKDILTGGSGEDVFVFHSSKEANGDVITDFQHGHDLIDLMSIDANVNVEGDQAFTFIGSERFHEVAGELHTYHLSDGNTYVSGDTDGDGKADFAIKALGYLAFAASDFVL